MEDFVNTHWAIILVVGLVLVVILLLILCFVGYSTLRLLEDIKNKND